MTIVLHENVTRGRNGVFAKRLHYGRGAAALPGEASPGLCTDRSPACRWGACQGAARQQHGISRGDCFPLSLTITPDGQNPVKQCPSGNLQIEKRTPRVSGSAAPGTAPNGKLQGHRSPRRKQREEQIPGGRGQFWNRSVTGTYIQTLSAGS